MKKILTIFLLVLVLFPGLVAIAAPQGIYITDVDVNQNYLGEKTITKFDRIEVPVNDLTRNFAGIDFGVTLKIEITLRYVSGTNFIVIEEETEQFVLRSGNPDGGTNWTLIAIIGVASMLGLAIVYLLLTPRKMV